MAVVYPKIDPTPDRPVVRIHEAREVTDLQRLLPIEIGRQGWPAGTYFNVQFMSRDGSHLLEDALFVVTDVERELVTNNANPYQPVTAEKARHRYQQRGPWYRFGEPVEHVATEGIEKMAGPGSKVEFNTKRHRYEVYNANRELVFITEERATADRVMRGEIAIPEAPIKSTWNPGIQKYQVKAGEHLVYETTDKVEANRIVKGELPFPLDDAKAA